MKKLLFIFISLITFITFINCKDIRSNSPIIDSIYLTVYSDELTYIADKPFEKNDGDWQISVPSLIIDENLTFIANAFNNNGDLIYQSNQIIKLKLEDNNISITFKSMVEYENLLITTDIIGIISEDDDTQIIFRVKNPNEDDITYNIYSDDNYEFTPNNGIIDSYDENSSYLLDINYSKPDTEGNYGNLITLVNSVEDQNILYRFTLNVDENGTVSLK